MEKMTSGRIYGGREMAAMLQNEGIPPEAIQALLASTSPPKFDGSRSILNFEDVNGGMQERSFFQHVDMEETCNDDLDECFHQPEKKRRLSSNQVQFLEKSFETENKLEPERKIQLARELGLQPRQVAIWFQNRRARWKTKQLEKDYDILKLNYNSLKSDCDNLIKEKEKLKTEVQILKDKLLHKGGESNTKDPESEENASPKHQLKQLDYDSGEKMKPILSLLECKQEDICASANSAIIDSNSPRCTAEGELGYSAQLEPADSSNRLGLDSSDLSHAEDDEEEEYLFSKSRNNSCNFRFPMEEEHALWSWPF